jgi:hypothetical protein
MTTARKAELRAEAASLFIGHGGVVGIAEGIEPGLTILLQSEGSPALQAMRDWAAENHVVVRFLVSGAFDVTG